MGMEVFKEFRFEAAHCLEHLPPNHKCRAIHGHSYRVRVFIGGAVGTESGWIVDFADIGRAVQPHIEQLDHALLNEIDGLDKPTTEHLATWLWARIAPELQGLNRLEIWETASSGCVYTGSA